MLITIIITISVFINIKKEGVPGYVSLDSEGPSDMLPRMLR